MRDLILSALLLACAAYAQQLNLDANSIVVTTTKSAVLTPTEVTFMITANVDLTLPLSQVLAAVDFGLTADNLVGVNSYPMPPYPPYGGVPTTSRINYTFRLSAPFSNLKDTLDKLEKLRKSADTGIDLSYATATVGPSQAAVQAAHDSALPDLMADAKKRAQAIASAAQLKLGAIQAVSENYYYPGGPSGPAQPYVTFSAVVRFGAQ